MARQKKQQTRRDSFWPAIHKPNLRTRAVEGLLRKFATARIRVTSARTDGRDYRSELPRDLRVRDWTQLSAEPCGALICQLDRVDLLERKGVELSRATNWAYWALGRAYRAFCEVGICPIASLLRSDTEGTKLGMIVLSRADCLPNYANLKASWFKRKANGAETLCRTACYQPESMCIWWTYSGKRFSMRHP